MLTAFQALSDGSEKAVRDLQEIQAAWFGKAMPAKDTPPHLTAAMAASQHTLNVHQTLHNTMLRQLHIWQNSLTHSTTSASNPHLMSDLLSFQKALMEVMAENQEEQLKGWRQLLEEIRESRRANTVSKMIEQDWNVKAQLLSLLVEQMSSTAELLKEHRLTWGIFFPQIAQRGHNGANRTQPPWLRPVVVEIGSKPF